MKKEPKRVLMAAFMVATMLVVPMASISLVSDCGSDYEAYAEATDRSGKKVSIIGDGIYLPFHRFETV